MFCNLACQKATVSTAPLRTRRALAMHMRRVLVRQRHLSRPPPRLPPGVRQHRFQPHRECRRHFQPPLKRRVLLSHPFHHFRFQHPQRQRRQRVRGQRHSLGSAHRPPRPQPPPPPPPPPTPTTTPTPTPTL